MEMQYILSKQLYICEDCDEIFEEQEAEIIEYRQKCGDWYEDCAEICCPYCGSEFIEEYYEDDEAESSESDGG